MDRSRLFNLYLGLVSILSIIALAINIGIIFAMLGNYFLISDSEYLSSRKNDYVFTSCERSDYDYYAKDNTQTILKTPEEIEKCKKEKETSIITERKYDLKINLITAFSWFVVFLVLFGFHYPKFKNSKES